MIAFLLVWQLLSEALIQGHRAGLDLKHGPVVPCRWMFVLNRAYCEAAVLPRHETSRYHQEISVTDPFHAS